VKYKLSKTMISSFEGDIIPITLTGNEDISQADIKWSVENDCIVIRTFEGDNFGFTNGVLVTLVKEGSSKVYADLDSVRYSCDVSVRKRKQADPNGKFNFYFGDFHDHTTHEHNHERFAVRETELISEYLEKVHKDEKMDVMVISDHSDSSNKSAFFEGFTEEEKYRTDDLVIFPGAESEVTKIEEDRLGFTRKNSGEIVTINCDNFSGVRTWEDFYADLSTSYYGICILAHPQILGWDKNGIWNFSLHKNNTDTLKKLVKYIEIGNGTFRESNLINEYMYSVALDNGFFVSTTCSSDSHGPKWGYDVFPGKTIIMAPEKSREMFLDALLNRRAYACESGNIKLLVNVNGMIAPCTVEGCSKYDFHVDLSYFSEDASTVPTKCEVISNYGETVKVFENIDFSSFDFTIESDSAAYFYLRFIDDLGRRTFSPPVLTGKVLPKHSTSDLIPIPKDKFTASGDASAVINNDPCTPWYSDSETASIIIDMGEERSICAVGHYPYRFVMSEVLEKKLSITDIMKGFPHKYNVSVSVDGENYVQTAVGFTRVFGQEEVAVFPEISARYVKYEVTETVGKRCGCKDFADAHVCLGELTVFESKK